MSNMAAPDAAAPAAEIAATAHVHDLEPAMAATLTPIRAILAAVDAYDGERVRVGGWVRTGRVQCGGTVAFLAVNDGSCHATLQLVVDAAQVAQPPLARLAATGTSVLVSGVLRIPTKRSKERIELGVDAVLHAGLVDDAAAYPLPKSRLRLDYLRDFLHLRPRTETIAAVARMRSQLTFATHSFFQENGFLCVHTPIVTTNDCEGAGEMFQVTTLFSQAQKADKEVLKLKLSEISRNNDDDDGSVCFDNDFFRRQAFLTVSGQLHAEPYACALSRVYTFGPTFRAENSHTSRHLAEFWMVEPEMAFANLQDIMNYAESYVKHLCQWLLTHCLEDMKFMVETHDKTAIQRLERVSTTPFERISYTQAIEMLVESEGNKKFQTKVEWGIDLASEHERYLTEVIFEKPVIVYNYPTGIKAFYMRLNDDQKTVAAMDVLVPKVGELIGGSQREERLDILKQRILDAGLQLESYEFYLDLRRYGTVEHSGFGLGFERMLLFATGLENIRDVIPFPRCPGKADL
ncbi:hypothetical protein QYE76_058480 [Lolium multiflorum]|uniref:asparagine--tRNA ligase n=1 Tax=Lolium multiflorum TaxID=4521 RepID=A0AAD8T5J1_LOLMU|nr:hypothetical protein QYE76_058480 [Lolium multiflorum]